MKINNTGYVIYVERGDVECLYVCVSVGVFEYVCVCIPLCVGRWLDDGVPVFYVDVYLTSYCTNTLSTDNEI